MSAANELSCWAHPGTTFAGRHIPVSVPAVCLWLFAKSGNVVPLCEFCACGFFANAMKEPDLGGTILPLPAQTIDLAREPLLRPITGRNLGS